MDYWKSSRAILKLSVRCKREAEHVTLRIRNNLKILTLGSCLLSVLSEHLSPVDTEDDVRFLLLSSNLWQTESKIWSFKIASIEI